MPDQTRRALVLGSAAAALLPSAHARAEEAALGNQLTYPFALPPLPYAPDTNAAAVDAETMLLHHDAHHAAYVKGLNAALKDHPDLQAKPLRELLAGAGDLPVGIRDAVRNSGGGHANHSMFWEVMGGRGGAPTGDLLQAVTRDFGSLEGMQAAVNRAGSEQFGSGWAFLVTDKVGKLQVVRRPNQDSPWADGSAVVLGNDVWEHAYYLRYRNRRADYLSAWWSVVDWPRVEGRYAAARAGTLPV